MVGGVLCRVFDRWIREDVGRTVVQHIDEALRPIYGLPHALCVHRETCGEVAVLDRGQGELAGDLRMPGFPLAARPRADAH